MQDKTFHNKVTWFSFFFSLLVIWVHSYNIELHQATSPGLETVYRLQHAIGEGLSQIAVPGFFVISGYLFFRNFTWKKLPQKWRRRIRSVLIPYIVWNFLYYLGYVIGSHLPWIGNLMGKGVIPFQLFTAFDAIVHFRYNYVFWYLYQLILLIAIAPILYLFLQFAFGRILLVILVWVMVIFHKNVPVINGDAMIYFATAGALALGLDSWVEERQEGNRILQVAIGAITVMGSVFVYHLSVSRNSVPLLLLCRLLAVAGLWTGITGTSLPEAKDFMKYNFLLYAIHFVFVRFINKIIPWIFPGISANPVFLMGLYLIMPALIWAIGVPIGKFLKKRTPLLWSLLNGGR